MRVIINRAGYLVNACTFNLCGIAQGNVALASEIARRGFTLVDDKRGNRQLSNDLLLRLGASRLSGNAAKAWARIEQAVERETMAVSVMGEKGVGLLYATGMNAETVWA